MKKIQLLVFIMLVVSSICLDINAQKPRARDLGIPFEGMPGPLNAITDVAGVEVGHSTIIRGDGKQVPGTGPVRTGVTAIFPRGKAAKFSPVYANWYSLNGNGEMTGTTWITESGFLETPVMITNTNSVGVVRDAVLKWYVENDWYKGEEWWYTYPVVGETYDGVLNDIYGFHVEEKHVREAIADAKPGPVPEGNVGGGTGMMCMRFKSGIGTASRVVTINGKEYTLGVLVQANFGTRDLLTIAGVPVGKHLMDTLNWKVEAPPQGFRREGDGSIIVIVATDAPLLPHQLKRIAQRVPLGIALVGGLGYNGSGDIFLAFSTANENAFNREKNVQVESLPNDQLNWLFYATRHAVEESIINALVAAETMNGINGNTVYALPHDKVRQILKKYHRLAK
jgi:L-aminopeptidase/D-esterase-like protein